MAELGDRGLASNPVGPVTCPRDSTKNHVQEVHFRRQVSLTEAPQAGRKEVSDKRVTRFVRYRCPMNYDAVGFVASDDNRVRSPRVGPRWGPPNLSKGRIHARHAEECLRFAARRPQRLLTELARVTDGLLPLRENLNANQASSGIKIQVDIGPVVLENVKQSYLASYRVRHTRSGMVR
jgi:hypothetical protein